LDYSIVRMHEGDRTYYTVLPLSQNDGKVEPEPDRPYTAYEVLTKFYGEDFSLTIGNFVKMEPEQMKKCGMPEDANDIRLISTKYIRTQSVLFQYTAGTYVDFLVSGLVEATTPDKKVRRSMVFRVRYIIDMIPCHKCVIGPMIAIDNGWKTADLATKWYNLEETETEAMLIPTNDYLLPILYASDYERISKKLIQEYFPEYRNLEHGISVKAEELAKRMGLKIVYARMKDNSKMGQLFFMDGTEAILDAAGRTRKKKFRCGTILINTDRCTTQAIINTTIVHECVHMYLHRTFFLLQFMTGKPYTAYALTSRDAHSLYRRFLSMNGALSLERCNDILMQENLSPLIQTALIS